MAWKRIAARSNSPLAPILNEAMPGEVSFRTKFFAGVSFFLPWLYFRSSERAIIDFGFGLVLAEVYSLFKEILNRKNLLKSFQEKYQWLKGKSPSVIQGVLEGSLLTIRQRVGKMVLSVNRPEGMDQVFIEFLLNLKKKPGKWENPSDWPIPQSIQRPLILALLTENARRAFFGIGIDFDAHEIHLKIDFDRISLFRLEQLAREFVLTCQGLTLTEEGIPNRLLENAKLDLNRDVRFLNFKTLTNSFPGHVETAKACAFFLGDPDAFFQFTPRSRLEMRGQKRWKEI